MIRQSARLLPRAKLEGLIHGLRQRCAAGAERIAHEVQVLREALAELESSSTQAATAEQARHAQQYAATITDWDQRRLSAWDEVEQRVVRTIKGTAAAEKEARSAAKQRSEQIASELKERYADIEKRFLRSKDKAVLQLNQARQQVERLGGDLAVIQQEATNLLAQRGLTPEPISVVQIDEPPTNSASAIAACRHELQQAQQHLQRLSNHPLARLIESIGFWVGCLLGGSGIAAIIGSLGWLNWPIALVVGLVVAVVLGISGMLAVHPWLRRLLKTEFPLVESALAQARAMQHAAAQLAIAENDAELKRIAHKRDDRYAKANEWREQAAKEVGDQLKQELNRLKEELASKQVAMRAYLTLAIQEIDQAGAKSEQNLVEAFQKHQLAQMQHVAAERARIEQLIHRTDRGGAERMQIALEHALNWFSRSQQWNQANAPRWEQMLSDDSWPQALSRPILPLGQVQVEALLAGQQSAKRDTPVAAPLYFEPLQDQYLTITADPNSSHCQQLIKALLLRTLTSLPPGKTQVMVIDPPGLGRDYGWLMHLGDYDAELVSHRVWTQSNHIAKNLSQLALKAEDFIQQSLRNQYATIEQYNREAGPLAEPFRILLWSSFPVGLDDQSWKPLQSILDTGARCGIVPIFVIDPAQPWDSDQRRELLMRRGLHVRWNDETKGWIAETPALRDLPIRTAEPPSEEVTDALVHQVGRRALLASRVEVPLSGIAPPRDQWWQADSSGSLDIPIGQSGVGRVQSLKLGVGTAQHAIVAGKTGSGKSTLLHAIITSAAVKYSPERLRLVLLDFKKGVEFQAYSQAELPHADIIGIESQREFGLSALQYVDQCLQSRGDMFRQAGVQDLQSWNLLNPSQQLPRMMIVIDEFQELFVEDDKLTSQVSLILDRIVRQGRSFGVHAVLSSQTLAGAYSLPRTTMGQMAIRIALQCDPSDAQLIFADDNPAAARLQHPGQAVYNDQGGRIEGNQSMQIGWLTKKDMLDWLNHLPGRGYRNTDPSTNVLGRTVVFDGNRAATWDSGAASRAVTAARTQWNPDACWCVLGESVAISPAVTVPLTDQAGRNLMLVGSDDSQAASVALAIARSFAAHYAPQRVAKLALLQAAKPTDACCLSLPQHLQAISSDVQVADVRGLESLLGELHAQLKSRIEQPEGFAQWQPILLTIVNIGRFRDLRPEDEFGMGSFGESKLTPDKQLEELLRDGPSHHIHILLMAENANTIGRWLSRAALREIEIRLLMQMSANDSTQLIDSVAAAHLGEHVMLLHDDATSSELRFRPYAFDSLTEAGAASNKADT